MPLFKPKKMLDHKLLKGVILVGLGATSYGMLATFVKIAYTEGYSTAEVTTAQFVYGLIGLLTLNLIFLAKKNNATVAVTQKETLQLIAAGTSTGLTSLFYYLAVKYIPVSIGIVLLMQTVWMGVLLEWFLDKKAPSFQKISAVFIVLLGTALAINILKINFDAQEVDWAAGLFWGLLAAASFTTTMFTANRIATSVPVQKRSILMLLGGAIIVFSFALFTQETSFNMGIFSKWGIVLALFGTIIPPLLLNAGFPHTGIGLGSIVSSLELPVSVLMAYFILNEEVIAIQWFGIVLIISAIIIMNLNFKKKS